MAEITQKQEYKCEVCNIKIDRPEVCLECWELDYMNKGAVIILTIFGVIFILWLML